MSSRSLEFWLGNIDATVTFDDIYLVEASEWVGLGVSSLRGQLSFTGGSSIQQGL